MPKIGWVCDYDCMVGEGGGGELSERAVIVEGIKRGHDIEIVTPHTPNKQGVLTADIVILGSGSRFSPQLLAQLVEQQEVVMYLHDFWPLCKYRLFYSDLEKCKTTCPNLPLTKKLLLSSTLRIFLSPLHQRLWERAIPELADRDAYLHVSPVDTDLFQPMDVPKVPNSSLCVNCLARFKDLDNTIKYAKKHPERTITCIGAQEPNVKLPANIVPIGNVPQVEMPGMYAQTEEFLHLVNYCEPCGRTTIEAKLCNTPLKLNKLVGVASYKEFKYGRDKFAAWIKDSPRRFWRKIEELI